MKKIAWTSEKLKNRIVHGLPPEELEEPQRNFDDFDFDAGYSDEDDDWISNSNTSYNYGEDVDYQISRTKYGAAIEVDSIPVGVLDEVQLFYVCEQCGKCYWDGSHRGRTLDGFIGQLVRH